MAGAQWPWHSGLGTVAVAQWPGRSGRGVAVSQWRGDETVLARRARGKKTRRVREREMPERVKARRQGGWHTEVKGVCRDASLGGQGGVCRPVVNCVDCKHQCYDTPA